MTDTAAPPPDASRASENLLRAWFLLLAALSYAFFVYNLFLDYRAGGHSWKQGDWLINTQSGAVRRGLAGDAVLWLADALAVGPVAVVIGAQVAIVAVLYLLAVRLAFAAAGAVPFVLALSPGFFAAFWVTDPLGSARKEMLVFVALLLCALAVLRGGRWAWWLGCVCLVAAVAAHEALVLFVPVFWGPYALGERSAERAWVLAVASAAAVALFAYGVANSRVADVGAICQPLLDRGVGAEMCTGAIKWLEFDFAFGLEFVRARTRLGPSALFALAYLVALAPFLYVAFASAPRRLCAGMLVGPMLLFLPLYAFTADHGRWVSFHVFASFVLFAVAFGLGRVALARALNGYALMALFAVSQVIAPTHVREVYFGGVVRKLLFEDLRALF